MTKYKFPKDFLWGASTSSHQVEGGNKNDWTEWENAGKVANKDKSGKAANYWNLYEKDFDILKKLNLNSYRFSIEWSRIEPEKGKFDKKALSKYRKMLEALHKRKITPVVTLHHFTNPKWLPNWDNRDNIGHFLNYTDYVVRELGDLVEYWVTINEPSVYSVMSYQQALWPPGIKNYKASIDVMKNMSEAHKVAYEQIHDEYARHHWPEPMVSMAFNLHSFSSNSNPINKMVANVARSTATQFTLNIVKNHLDYIGVNYYFHHQVKFYSMKSITDIKETGTSYIKNDLGWDINPDGLMDVLIRLKKYNLPIVITENGIPDETDKQRAWYIEQNLKAVHEAISEGVDVKGYLHWSLLDNFEWHEGYYGRFGLVEVDFKSQKRTIRKSAKVYAKIAKNNTLEVK